MLSNKKISITAPSNIAIVKYWGKKGRQLPQNPSISFTLKNSVTKTEIICSPKKNKENQISFNFENKDNIEFQKKIINLFHHIVDLVPQINDYDYVINSSNTFPHSSGIASSASSFAALSLGIGNLFHLDPQKIKSIARIGSGSATRSFNGPWVIWGENSYIQSSDEFGMTIKDIHPDFLTIQDAILIVDKEVKSLSSSKGHSLMNGHPFADIKFKMSLDHTKELLLALKNGDFYEFKRISEYEALSLHAMMMSSNPPYLLLKPKSLEIVEKIQQSNLPMTFTIDAGPNIHCLYLKKHEDLIKPFLEKLNVEIIFDQIGIGAEVNE